MSGSKDAAQLGVNDHTQGVAPKNTYGTQALADFLTVIGSGVADLNTIAVGLAAIGPDHIKPEGLNVSWSPSDPVTAARKARKAAVHAAMVVAVEALSQYVRAIIKLPRFEKLNEEWRLRRPTPSAAERFSELTKMLLSSPPQGRTPSEVDFRYRTCCVLLLIHWRNRHVHTDSNAELTHQEKQLIHSQDKYIREAYAGLDVDQLFGDFKKNRPTLKDATTLIAMAIQEVRAMDEAVFACQDAADLNAWLDHYELTDRIKIIQRDTKPERQRASILRILHTHAPYLKPWYEKYHPEPQASSGEASLA